MVKSRLNLFGFLMLSMIATCQQSQLAPLLLYRQNETLSSNIYRLNDDLVQAFYELVTIDKWQGHRRLAFDGSVTQLPISDELHEHFGKARSHAAMPAVRLSQLYDVKNNITLDL